jgi:hypothetical protein
MTLLLLLRPEAVPKPVAPVRLMRPKPPPKPPAKLA